VPRSSASIQLYRLVEGDYFVRGTLDLEKVKELLLDDEYVRDDAPEDVDWDIVLTDVSPGRWRFNPCICGEHSWDLGWVGDKGSRRGSFEGVHVTQYEYVEITYEMDEDPE
jgi:hypothetical protein